MSTRAIWRGNFEFGMLSVACKLVAAARADKQTFQRVNPVTGAAPKQRNIDPISGCEVTSKELVKQTRLEDGRVVRVTSAEIDALLAEDAKTIDVIDFVALAEVDPIYFDASYYLVPDEEKPMSAYELLSEVLNKTKAAAVCKWIRQHREYLVLVRFSSRGLVLHTLFYEHEVRDDYIRTQPKILDLEALRIGKAFVRAGKRPWNPSKYQDSFARALQVLLESKVPEEEADIVADLAASLKAAKKAKKKA